MAAPTTRFEVGDLDLLVSNETVMCSQEGTREDDGEDAELDFEEVSVEEGEISDGDGEEEQDWWGNRKGGSTVNPVGQSLQESRMAVRPSRFMQ
ncbi:hypothetical protein NDU88_002863 [Pleurodeles waltl]|uniref:Uncharacterized protein n=1 Tax=Pleurodeles waltl TaxID=8319 RepID=A0AAV7M1V5_PLEWA|nr:hypothetical protein NDU88_002863 [Pleurodeles waltl]